MTTSTTRRTCLLFAGLLAACGASKPDAPVTELAMVGDTVASPYGEISEAAWLGQNRWAVLAQLEETVAIADLTRKALAPVGRTSRQLRNPANIFFAADTLYVGDWGLRRLTLWAPSGKLARSIPAPSVTRGTLPRARDGVGRYYLDRYPAPGPDGSGNRDSAAVIRSDSSLTRIDTIARLAPLDIAEVVGDAGRRFERRVVSGGGRGGGGAGGALRGARGFE